MSNQDKFIGKGLVFPIQLDSTGKPPLVGGMELLESSIRTIMSWYIGTRFFLGEFGSRLEDLLQEPNDLITQSLVEYFTAEVISKWEKRLKILEVDIINRDEYILNIIIKYEVVSTKQQNSFIYPYYSQTQY
jgi:phage baseplate assembly protein W